MAWVNENFTALQDSYLFSQVAHKVAAYSAAHPEQKIIRLGIGDVTLPLAPVVVEAMQKAAAEMGVKETFRGYGPEQGYGFLQEALVKYYAGFGVTLEASEVFISDGAKSDCGNITDIFDDANVILVPDPVYPVYLDTNRMRGRKIRFMEGTPENGFLAMPDPAVKADIIYLCSPNNPTGAAYSKAHLKEWVAYARQNGAVILYDAAYEAFIEDGELPRSIFQIEGAKECAIELCSLSKTAGFTGTRCGYTVVPLALKRKTKSGKELSLNKMWLRRQTTKFNGVPYVVQRAAEAVFTPEGQKQCRANLAYYKENARLIGQALEEKGILYYGGTNSPYIWLQCPRQMKSWEFFDFLLEKLGIVGTPGSGFGNRGEGWFRLTAFASREATEEAVARLRKYL